LRLEKRRLEREIKEEQRRFQQEMRRMTEEQERDESKVSGVGDHGGSQWFSLSQIH